MPWATSRAGISTLRCRLALPRRPHAWSDLPGYIAAQVVGGIVAAAVLYLIASGKVGFEAGGFAANGFGEHSPGGYQRFLRGRRDRDDRHVPARHPGRHPQGRARRVRAAGHRPGLTLIHLISIPVSNTSVNPARSTAASVFWLDPGARWPAACARHQSTGCSKD